MAGRVNWEANVSSNVREILEYTDKLRGELEKLENGNYGIKLNIDEKRLANVISNLDKMLSSLGKGSGDFKQFENLSKELSNIVSEVQNLSKAFGKVDDSGTKTLLSSIQNIDKSLSELSQHILNVNKNMSNIGGDTNGIVKQVENISNAYDNASKSAEKLADAQSKIGNKSNISSGTQMKDVFQGDSKSATEVSTSAIKEESKALEQVSTSAKEAATSKEKFANANKEVKASADSSKTSISEEEKYFNSLGKSLKQYQNTLTSISRKPADGSRSKDLQEKINIISSSLNELETLKSKTEENGYIFNKNDVETGRQLEKIIKENIELVRQMPAAQKGSDALSRGKEIDTITKYLNKFTGISKQAKEELKGLIDQLQSGDPSVNVKKIHERFLELTAAERMAGRETKSFFDIFKNKVVHRFIGQLAMYYLSFYDFIRYARNAITAVRELDTALIDLKKTTTMSASELEQFYYDSNDVAKQMGVSTKEIIEQASAWSRLGSYIHTDLLYRNI